MATILVIILRNGDVELESKIIKYENRSKKSKYIGIHNLKIEKLYKLILRVFLLDKYLRLYHGHPDSRPRNIEYLSIKKIYVYMKYYKLKQ